jgi:DNA (cytosine-5)-methyltransferase 1
MAGFNVAWASEFIPAAQETYRANHHDTILDTRDIRKVDPDSILQAMKIEKGQLDLFDGSPPCASFSTAGKREAGWGETKKYSDTKQRTDDLFFEYARILRGLMPKVFVAENVSGLIKGTAKGYFLQILKALKESGYRVEARLLDAQWLGVPQARQRLIFMGVRNDIGLSPIFPKPLPYQYTVRDAIPWIKKVAVANNVFAGSSRPSKTILAIQGLLTKSTLTGESMGEVEAECDITRFAIGKEYDRMGSTLKSDKYFNLVKPNINKACPTILAEGGNTGAAGVVHPTERRKFSIAELKRVCGFPDDFILTGTFAQQWERLGRAVPPVMMAAIAITVRDEILCKIK